MGEGSFTSQLSRRRVSPPAPGPDAPARPPGSTGSETADHMLRSMRAAVQEQLALTREIRRVVGTLDLIVYEHDTQELPPSADFFTMSLQPQTAQTELIRGIFASITVPTQITAPIIEVTNAWVKLGAEYVNLNSLLVSANGTGGMMPGNFTFVLPSQATREITVVSSDDWPAGSYLTFALFGEAVPSMEGGVLH